MTHVNAPTIERLDLEEVTICGADADCILVEADAAGMLDKRARPDYRVVLADVGTFDIKGKFMGLERSKN